MKFSLPHKYVATPAWVIFSAFQAKPEKRALLGNYNRLLSLSWDRSDKSTPILRESECYEFLGLERRQFFQIIKEMEGMRWLRSERPRPGCVQFFFHGDDPASVIQTEGNYGSAESRTDSAKNRTELKRNEEDSLIKLNTESSSSINPTVRKIAPVQKNALQAETESVKEMQTLVEQLPILFDPDVYGGPLEMRDYYLGMVPDYALGWIVKAYKERDNLRKGGGALGLIVNGLNSLQAPNPYYLANALKILPEAYLEAIGRIEYECDYCTEKFDTRKDKESHQHEKHPYPCTDCAQEFPSEEARAEHWLKTHDLLRVRGKEDSAPEGALAVQPHESVTQRLHEGRTMSPAQAWRAVLGQLQLDMPRASFETWVRDTQALRYDGNVLTVATANQYAADWLENRLTSTVERLLIGILNTEVRVRFVVGTLVEVES